MCEDKLYPIRPDLGGYHELSRYFTGLSLDRAQSIIFRDGAKMYRYQFDELGHYLGRSDRMNTEWRDDSPPAERMKVSLAGVIAWAAELGMPAGTIHVLKFQSERDGPMLQIKDYPAHFEDGDLATMGTEEEREQAYRWWHGLEAFVLRWNGTEYYLDRDGERFQ